ncbi:hypothetical protein ACTA71_007707 [Dictyostelium dimigraforme]
MNQIPVPKVPTSEEAGMIIEAEKIQKQRGFNMEIKVAEGILPVKRTYSKMAEEEINKIGAEIKRLLDIGVIEESHSIDRRTCGARGIEKLRKEKVYLADNKAELFKNNVKFFGHMYQKMVSNQQKISFHQMYYYLKNAIPFN